VIKAKKLSELQMKGLAFSVEGLFSFIPPPAIKQLHKMPSEETKVCTSHLAFFIYNTHRFTQERITKLVEVGRVRGLHTPRPKQNYSLLPVDCDALWLDTAHHLYWLYSEHAPAHPHQVRYLADFC
jgi:hypothetical protein